MFSAALVCLALNVYHEARGEPIDGQIAVAQVTMNRVASPRYPDDVCEVVYQDYQFSWTAEPTPATDPDALAIAFALSAEVMNGRTANLVGHATHYFAPEYADPHWAQVFATLTVIGGHKFMAPQ